MYSFLVGPGTLGGLIREHDWSHTPLGPIEAWPRSLKTSVSLMLNSTHPMWIGWGPRVTFLYNDAYIEVLGGAKHPWALGRPAAEVWAEIWDVCGPLADKVFARGEASFVDDVRLFMNRGGFVEETFYSFSYSPIRDESGQVGGLFCPSNDVTAKVVGARRLRTLTELATQAMAEKSTAATCDAAMRTIGTNPDDIPFALLYLADQDAGVASLAGRVGLGEDSAMARSTIDLTPARVSAWPIAAAVGEGRTQRVSTLGFEGLPAGVAQQPVREALVLPVVIAGQLHAAGALVAGVSPGSGLTEEVSAFFGLVAGQVGAALQNARAAEAERQRAEALAELDRAKTQFFSNVSHEFRTPLTLIMGPLEDALADAEHALPAPQHERLVLMRRNALRLQKLVNMLLDFSRVEAGRAQAAFAPTDLATLTADLASSFRSALEGAGLALTVDCAPLHDPIYVDRSMWEQIVLNLLSNALKFTFEGGVQVHLGREGADAVLRVIDSGVGIPATHLPRLFERFHRIEGTRSRTHEGSGIGLALVRDLVRLHGGEIGVASEQHQGSTFTVRLPVGHAHLPEGQVRHETADVAAHSIGDSFVAEAERWRPAADPAAEESEPPAATPDVSATARIVVADDNADLRDYVGRLLGTRWQVQVVGDGAAALAALKRHPADLLVSDVMMPVLDGFGLLKALRSDAELRELPVLFLSARAGESSRVEALSAGADDHLVKPFNARELVARVETLLLRSRLRATERWHEQRTATVFAQAPVAIAILRGAELVFELANPAYMALVGGRALVGLPVRVALPELADQSVFELLDQVYRSGQAHVGRSLRLELLDAQGQRREHFYDFVYQPMFDIRDAIEGIAIVAFEVTDLTRARRSAELANRAKDEFLAMLGHELRNPLAAILNALQLMRLRGVGGVERERQVIERQAHHLLGLVDDLLDVSRITEGKVNLKREPVEAAALVAKALEIAGALIEERGHRLELEVPTNGLLIEADLLRFSQVVANLLNNAAKYTEPGGRIRVHALRDGGDVLIEVRDSGIGIAAEMLPRVFERFVQERQALDRARGGLGLGLAIVKSLIELHGGAVQVDSAGIGRGSVFTLRVPAAATALPTVDAAAAAASLRAPTGAARGAHLVLIVDDNADAALALAECLAMHGYGTRVAFNGPAALQEAARFGPDVVLLDIGLPGMDGYEVAARLRGEPRFSATRLLAVSGYAQGTDRQRSERAGFERHLVKPVDIDQLRALIDNGPS